MDLQFPGGQLAYVAVEGLSTSDFSTSDFLPELRARDERSGCCFDVGEANTFNDFISCTDLFDFPLSGRRFTRFDKDGSKASKMDKFMVTHSFFDVWNDANVSVLCRSYSDHCPVLLKLGSLNFGLKPYKVFDKWIRLSDFKDVISNSWGVNISGSEVLSKNLVDWGIKAEARLISDADVLKREEWLMDLNYLDQLRRDDLRHKSQLRWDIEGDETTRYFHYVIKSKYANFSIKGVH
nr:cytochrome P450 [Tanacetum cinerariifolium]